MRILAVDLGKFKSVACDYDVASGEHSFTTVATGQAKEDAGTTLLTAVLTQGQVDTARARLIKNGWAK